MSELKIAGQPAWRPSAVVRASGAWHELVNHLTGRLAALRQDLEKDSDPIATAKTRGQIAEVKRLLDLNQDLPVPE